VNLTKSSRVPFLHSYYAAEGKIEKAMKSGGKETKQFKILIRKYFKIRFTWKVEKRVG
jgi:hypothetical protein